MVEHGPGRGRAPAPAGDYYCLRSSETTVMLSLVIFVPRYSPSLSWYRQTTVMLSLVIFVPRYSPRVSHGVEDLEKLQLNSNP